MTDLVVTAVGPVRLVEGDICDRELVKELMSGIDVVFHLAAIRITQCAEEPRLAHEVLVDGSYDVFEAAVEAGVRRVIASSSASVYGLAEEFPTSESHHPFANDTLYGLGAGVWSRDTNTAYRAGRDIQAGRVWVNCYHVYPAHAAFGGYKQSGIGRENHKMMLDHYQQTKNLLVSYSEKAQGFF